MSFVELAGLERLIARVHRLEKPDATPLMATWIKIFEEDNRKGVLAGTDKDGNRMAPVKYRPKTAKPLKIGSKGAASARNNASARAKVGIFANIGSFPAGLNNNLMRKQYEQLDGPPLAPRRQFSRAITNLKLDFNRDPDFTKWTVRMSWGDVVSTKGVPFMKFHFDGRGRLPRRDLRGVRPEGLEKARKALIAWMSDQVRSAPTGGG